MVGVPGTLSENACLSYSRDHNRVLETFDPAAAITLQTPVIAITAPIERSCSVANRPTSAKCWLGPDSSWSE